ncbi:MAG: hypothetical protein IPK80_02330 [Nannocystis sp.]|nr:hypothetical protein [Nannocystis sp.]
MRKFEAIDLAKLYALGSANGWNEVLNERYAKRDIDGLAKLRYQIAAGMDDLAKKKLNTEEMNIWFIRLNRSIENTAKKILREKYPLPEDNPLDFENRTAVTGDMKKKRDDELAKFFKRSAY